MGELGLEVVEEEFLYFRYLDYGKGRYSLDVFWLMCFFFREGVVSRGLLKSLGSFGLG